MVSEHQRHIVAEQLEATHTWFCAQEGEEKPEQKVLCSSISERHERLWSAVRVGIQASKPWFPQVLSLSLSLSSLCFTHRPLLIISSSCRPSCTLG
jgi:hypothetical protein